MIKTLIVAKAQNNAIGKDNDLPWHLPNDMKHFKSTTIGHHVIMGRKNYESIPERFRPLPDRVNIVLTKNPTYKADGCKVAHNINGALSLIDPSETEVFIIGGASIYNMFLPSVDKLIVTEVETIVEDADTFFSNIDWSDWEEIERVQHIANEKNQFNHSFVTFTKK